MVETIWLSEESLWWLGLSPPPFSPCPVGWSGDLLDDGGELPIFEARDMRKEVDDTP